MLVQATYFILYDVKERKWLGVAKNRNRTSAKLTNTEPPRLFKNRRAALLAFYWWRDGEYASDYTGDYKLIKKREESTGAVVVLEVHIEMGGSNNEQQKLRGETKTN